MKYVSQFGVKGKMNHDSICRAFQFDDKLYQMENFNINVDKNTVQDQIIPQKNFLLPSLKGSYS